MKKVVLYERLARWAARFTSAVAATSGPLADRIRAAAPRTPVHVIPNGIPVGPLPTPAERAAAREALRLPADVLVVAFVGRLSPEKAPEVLLRAVRGTATRILVAGEGPLREALAAEADPEQVRFLGFLSDVLQCSRPRTCSRFRRAPRACRWRCSRPWPPGFRWWRARWGRFRRSSETERACSCRPATSRRSGSPWSGCPSPRSARPCDRGAATGRVPLRSGDDGEESTRASLYQPALDSAGGRARSPLLHAR